VTLHAAPASASASATVIYFTDEVRDALHARLVTALRPGGCLVVGATERVSDPAGIGLTATHPFTDRKL